MERIEKINAKALEKVDYDRYLLAVVVAKRVEELSNGAKPLLHINPKTQPTEIAIREIAEGLIQIKGE